MIGKLQTYLGILAGGNTLDADQRCSRLLVALVALITQDDSFAVQPKIVLKKTCEEKGCVLAGFRHVVFPEKQ